LSGPTYWQKDEQELSHVLRKLVCNPVHPFHPDDPNDDAAADVHQYRQDVYDPPPEGADIEVFLEETMRDDTSSDDEEEAEL
jgi:hypothetical protein